MCLFTFSTTSCVTGGVVGMWKFETHQRPSQTWNYNLFGCEFKTVTVVVILEPVQ